MSSCTGGSVGILCGPLYGALRGGAPRATPGVAPGGAEAPAPGAEPADVLQRIAPAGALPTLYAATAEDVSGGDYFGPKGPFEMTGPPAKAYMNKHARNDENAQKLWELSEQLTGVTYAI